MVDRLEDRLRTSTSYAEVVGLVRSGPPPWAPIAMPAVGGRLVIHHEDVRRAQPA